ncbi:uncharacterized protein BO87DRAFT_403614 [Aspergillus neoniger CBS 115656]|uniref:Uncharacterized protein n=1 Tax=Aspergillus neoniger (strain CBS 115656) TaxID=1448310 RepID=A0A318YVG3_ASPNB|nr:hypothetical protein BO87DRAFT_403614 [Aspergillus neoniger CBS 115656]PYH38845.1 hypothetical protein BO87DRAFT_403614 [Aspergillus neoniger CBS 115656]
MPVAVRVCRGQVEYRCGYVKRQNVARSRAVDRREGEGITGKGTARIERKRKGGREGEGEPPKERKPFSVWVAWDLKWKRARPKQIGCTAQRMPIGPLGMAMGSAEPKEWFPATHEGTSHSTWSRAGRVRGDATGRSTLDLRWDRWVARVTLLFAFDFWADQQQSDDRTPFQPLLVIMI